MNNYLFATINSLAGNSVWLDRIGIFLAVYLTYLIVMALVYGGFLSGWKYGKRMFWEAIIASLTARLLIIEAIRAFYPHPRPFMIEQVRQLIPESGWSFPSGHTTFVFAIAMTVWFYNRKFAYYLFAAGFLVGIARVYVGVHWPFDIFGGIATGILTSLAVHWLSNLYMRRKEKKASRNS